MTLENGGKFENLKIRINRNHILHRLKIKDKKQKDKYILKGKYEFEEKYDPYFMNKIRYDEKELIISPSFIVKLNEKIAEDGPLILPINLRRDQRNEINLKLGEKLKGNFIDESITKITKINRLERINHSRRESHQLIKESSKKLSIDINTSVENSKFNTINVNCNNKNNEKKDSNASINYYRGSHNFASNFTEKSRKVSLEIENRGSIYKNTESNNNHQNYESNKSERKIGNSKVFLLDNNFVICNNNNNNEMIYSAFNSIDNHGKIKLI